MTEQLQPWVSVAAIEGEAWKSNREELRRQVMLSLADSNRRNRVLVIPSEIAQISDGDHTFAELYDHRMILTAGLMRSRPDLSWRSKLHHDGTMFEGFFIVGMDLPKHGQITYHYPLSGWDLFEWVPKLDRAPEYDGHTSADVLTRLRAWLAE